MTLSLSAPGWHGLPYSQPGQWETCLAHLFKTRGGRNIRSHPSRRGGPDFSSRPRRWRNCPAARSDCQRHATDDGGGYLDNVSVTEVNPLNGDTTGATVGTTGIGDGGSAYTFDGVNDYVDIYSAEMNSTFNPDAGTLLAWAKVSDVGVWSDSLYRRIAYFGLDGSNRIDLSKSNVANQLQVAMVAGGTTDVVVDTSLSGTTDYFVDVDLGEGTGRGYFIGANLNEGDLIYPSGEIGQIPKVDATINETIMMNYLGENIAFNHWNGISSISDSNIFSDMYWSKATGMLLNVFSRSEQLREGSLLWYAAGIKIDGLTETFNAIVDDSEFPIMVDSNSSITDFEFNKNDKRISFNANGFPETTGFCDITIPNDLLWGTFSLYKDGSPLVAGEDYTQTNNGTHYTFHITYNHSTHNIEIVGSDAIPEFLSLTPLLIILLVVAIIGVIYKRKLHKSNNGQG